MPEGFAEVITWGTKSTGGNGLNDQLKAKLFGGNIGHAAIRLSIPIDNTGNAEKMIEEQCYHNGQVVLPHTKKKLPNGNEVYEVYISAWSDDKVTLDRDFVLDSQEELEGVHFDWDPKWAESIQPETRRYKGLVGKSIMTWGPQVISHQRGNLSDTQFQQFRDIQHYQQNIRQIKNHNLLITRLNLIATSNKPIKLNDTEKILLDKLYPNWKSEIKNPKKISADELQHIISTVSNAKAAFLLSDSYEGSESKVNAIAKQKIKELIKLVEQDVQKWGKITPTTAQKIVDSKSLLLDSESKVNAAQIMSYTPQQIIELRKNLNVAITEPNPSPIKLESYFKNYTPSDEKLLDQNFAYGLAPDHIVQIPLKSQNADAEKTEGLDPQAMLARAKQVAISNEKFSLTKTNCSKVVGSVLSAGANDEKSKKIFSRDAFKLFATPQMAFNNALRYLRTTSKTANKKYDNMVDSALSKEQAKEKKSSEENDKSASFVPGFIKITFDGMNPSLTDLEKCKALLENFEHAIKEGDKVPYLSFATKLKVESIIKTDDALTEKFHNLCNESLAKARNQNNQFHEKKPGEWEAVKKIMQQQAVQGKISKKEHPELSRSYVILDINGELKPFKISDGIIGKGAEGKVRVIESEDGQRYAVKITANNESLDNEIALMKEAGATIGSFIRQKDEKFSKSAGEKIGDKRYIVQPLYEAELTSALNDKKMPLAGKLLLASQTAEAIQRLHDKSILHRDIKPSNLMLTKDKNGNITQVDAIDFGGSLKVPNPPGFANTSRLGSPKYFPPEIGRDEIRTKLNKWKTQERAVMQVGNFIVEATSHLTALSNQQKKLEGQQINDINMFFEKQPDGSSYIAPNNKQKLIDILKNYDGTNKDALQEQVKALATSASYTGAIPSLITTYCNTVDQTQSTKESITHFQQKKDEAVLKLENAKSDEQKFKSEFEDVYNTKTDFSLACDVYSFGIMLQQDFGLKLEELGLEKMLATEPSERPSMNEVQNVLNKLCEPSLAQKATQSFEQPTVRLPDKVNPEALNENGLLLNAQQMQKLEAIRNDQKNTHIKIDNITVFLSKEGGAFALHSPIQTGANGATYLAQNLDTKEWAAVKVVQGEERKIRGQLSALNTEGQALSDLNQRQGTLDITNEKNNHEIHICIQPYAYGKDYFDVIKQAKTQEQPLAIEQSVLMSLKAMEALVDIHEKGGYLHRDVKPENMLWDPVEKKCTFVDFGCAKKGEGPDKIFQDVSKQGTQKYAAPELDFDKMLKTDRVYSVKTDAYSLGVTIQDLLNATKPSDHTAYQQLQQLQAGLTAKNPEERISPTEALMELKLMAKTLALNGHAHDDSALIESTSNPLMIHSLRSTQSSTLTQPDKRLTSDPTPLSLSTSSSSTPEHESKRKLH